MRSADRSSQHWRIVRDQQAVDGRPGPGRVLAFAAWLLDNPGLPSLLSPANQDVDPQAILLDCWGYYRHEAPYFEESGED